MSWGDYSALPDIEQRLWAEKHDAESNRCKDCGSDREKCSHPDALWYPQRTICYAAMEAQAANRRYDELHEAKPFHDGTFKSWAKEPRNNSGVLSHPYHYRDGVSVWVAPVDLNPDDDFLTKPPAPDLRGGEHGDEA